MTDFICCALWVCSGLIFGLLVFVLFFPVVLDFYRDIVAGMRAIRREAIAPSKESEK